MVSIVPLRSVVLKLSNLLIPALTVHLSWLGNGLYFVSKDQFSCKFGNFSAWPWVAFCEPLFLHRFTFTYNWRCLLCQKTIWRSCQCCQVHSVNPSICCKFVMLWSYQANGTSENYVHCIILFPLTVLCLRVYVFCVLCLCALYNSFPCLSLFCVCVFVCLCLCFLC